MKIEPDWFVFILAILWAVVYFVIKPVLNLITLPIKFLTFGLSSIVINIIFLYLMQKYIPNIEIVGNYISYVFLALSVSVVAFLADLFKRFVFKK